MKTIFNSNLKSGKHNYNFNATALNSRTGEFIVIKAKAVVVATGSFGRCYEGETPLPGKYKFKYHFCPASLSGDGHAAVYRAGGELVNMELTGFGFKIRDDLTISYGNLPLNEGIPMKVFTWNGQEILNPNAEQYAELEKKGLNYSWLQMLQLLILNEDEKIDLINREPLSEKYIFTYGGGAEFIKNIIKELQINSFSKK